MSTLTVELPPEVIEQIAARAAEIVLERQGSTVSPWLDAEGAAEYLAERRDRIYDLVQVGKLSPHRDGRRLLFRREDLDAYLENGNGSAER